MGIRRKFRTLLSGQRRFASRGARQGHGKPRNDRWLLNRRFVSLMALSGMASLIGLTGAQTTASAADEKVIVSFTFDDGNDTQYSALEVFGRYGMHSTLYVNTGLVGTKDIMSWSQLHEFADA